MIKLQNRDTIKASLTNSLTLDVGCLWFIVFSLLLLLTVTSLQYCCLKLKEP